MDWSVKKILDENKRRNEAIPFNPYTGENSVGERFEIYIPDFPIKRQYLPVAMKDVPLVKKLIKAGSILKFITETLKTKYSEEDREKVIDQFVRVRCKFDFPFWCATFVKIKQKGGGEDVPFILSSPQRRFVEKLESKRITNKPIRLILLKARQWGGSTTSQMYMAWLQLIHKQGLNSLIIAHQVSGSEEIKDMFDRMINDYPIGMLYPLGATYNVLEQKLKAVGKSGATFRVPQRNCKIKIGTAEKPDSCRGGDYNLVHLSEVGIWNMTQKKKPEEIVASACSGIQLKPYTMIVYESTAKGSDNFFHREYQAAKKGESQFDSMFVSWFDIEWNSLPFDSDNTKYSFAEKLLNERDSDIEKTSREEPGKYLWSLWEKGATLEAINWYVSERAGKPNHDIMASESPSDDIEAFVHSGAHVFNEYQVEEMKKTCKPPKWVGEIGHNPSKSASPLDNLHFTKQDNGKLSVWSLPESDTVNEIITNRYLTVVDVGVGRSAKADYSVIVVFDRAFMMDGGVPSVVAQWYGHTDMDLLAWKAAQIAKFYNNSLLVIESNSLESRSNDSMGADHSNYILNIIADGYSNLYTRHNSPEDILENRPVKYGFHTNRATKTLIIDGLMQAVRDKLWVERDEGCLEEFKTYVQTKEGRYEAAAGCHDDRLMTRAIGLHICYNEMNPPKIVSLKEIKSKNRKAISEATI